MWLELDERQFVSISPAMELGAVIVDACAVTMVCDYVVENREGFIVRDVFVICSHLFIVI